MFLVTEKIINFECIYIIYLHYIYFYITSGYIVDKNNKINIQYVLAYDT